MIRRGRAVARRLAVRMETADRRVFDRVAAHPPDMVLDSVLPALGRSANYGRLWFGIAAGLALTGNRRARRAALRGLIALSAASAATNVVGKRLTRRPRPSTELVPVIRRLLRAPLTTSFPSGHSASAAAFTTGVALELPPLAVPVGTVAAGVALSRMVTGAHYPSDVLAGLTLGAGAGLLTLWWWPRTPGRSAKVHWPPERATASPTGSGVVAVVNAGAGGAGEELTELLGRELPEAEIVTVGPGQDLADVIASAADRAKVLGVAGGDGTINIAARHAADRELPLLVLPAGTLNHFAGELGLESARDAIAALRTGSAARVDLGRVGDEVFLNTCSTGLYADLVRFRRYWEPRVGKWPAVLIGLVHTLRRDRPVELRVNGEPRRLWLLFAGNGRYRPKGFAPTYRANLADGHLDLRMMDAGIRWARTKIVLAMLTRTVRWSPVYDAGTPTEVALSLPDGHARVSVDGEVTRLPGDFTIRVDRHGLLVYRPGQERD